jgi:nucleoside-diphosphate-sugar epimerase
MRGEFHSKTTPFADSRHATRSISLSDRMTDNITQLDDSLSKPSDELVASVANLRGDLLILGAGGKMGPTFARMARRAFDAVGKRSRVFAVSRFTNNGVARDLNDYGVETLSGDLFDSNFVRNLPDIENILYLVGMKFGTAADAARTWAANTYIAGLAADRFRANRIVALSTGNVYGLVPVACGRGSVENDSPQPDGEYAMSAVGRERVFEHFSRERGTPTVIVRLNYATEFRYGVLVDLAQKVHGNEPISLAMGYFNTIWQRDACDMILRTFDHAASPPLVLNVTGTERVSVRGVCRRFGELLHRAPTFSDIESDTALLSDASLASKLLGPPRTSVGEMTRWIADWIQRGGETWNKPTHFEVRDGKF